MQGEVIGIASFQMVEGQNLNFAIPSEKIVNLNLKEEKKTFATEELFEPESQAEKYSDYDQAYQKALYFMDKEEYDKALFYLEIAIKADDLSLKEYIYIGIGACYYKLDNYGKAIDAYIQAIRINPNVASTYDNLGVSYIQLGLYKDAIEAYKQAIRIDPEHVGSHFCLGLTYIQIGDKSSALDEYKILKNLDINLANKLFDYIY